MIYSAGDLGVQIDLGPDTPGMILQRRELDGWQDYRVDGEQVFSPVDIETLQPGYYRQRMR
jgi:hypothetical protein